MNWSYFDLRDWDGFAVADWDGFLIDPVSSGQFSLAAGSIFCAGSIAGRVYVRSVTGAVFTAGVGSGKVSQ